MDILFSYSYPYSYIFIYIYVVIYSYIVAIIFPFIDNYNSVGIKIKVKSLLLFQTTNLYYTCYIIKDMTTRKRLWVRERKGIREGGKN